MADVQRKLVHKQFNSPMGLYSQQNVAETLNRELKAFGSQGIEIDEQIAKPLNLANSAVLRAVEEEEEMKCEPAKKCMRESRSRQRCFQQRPHTPVHQQQLEQIKTQYLSHQHDITIDRDTVLKINRLATRRNLHKRDHSWPPTATVTTTGNEPLKNVVDNGNIVQHVRSTSNDNALQFDETVCKRHGIDMIRDKFNSPTRIIEPTAQEVRERREQQRRQQQCRNRSDSGGGGGIAQEKRERIGVDGHGICHAKEMINLRKHEELLRKNSQNKSTATKNTDKKDNKTPSTTTTTMPKISVTETKDMKYNKTVEAAEENKAEDDLFQTTTVPVVKGFSHPETKAADEDIGLVEPKRQFYEQLASGKKWYSYENLLAAVNAYPTMKPVPQCSHRRQAYSLERGRDKRQHKQLPPQKPRGSPKLQRRTMKLATEIKISYDADAQQHNIHVTSLNKPKQPAADNLEHIPLPAIPANSKRDDSKEKFIKDLPTYDDSCIFLRSIDLQDNTVAYIPAAITIVPSPTEEIMQHWMESNNLKANIKDATKSGNNNKQQTTDNLISKHQGQQQHCNGKQHVVETKATDTGTYVTHLPSTPNGIQLTRSTTNVNTKQHNTQMCSTGKTATTSNTTAVKSQGQATTNATHMLSSAEGDKMKMETLQKGVYYTDGEYVYGPYDPCNGKPLPNATVRSLEVEQQQKKLQRQQQQQQPQIKKDIDAERKCNQQQQHDTNDIANLTAKYEHIQKSINEHLRQIDAYIESAKTALKSTVPASSLSSSSSSSTGNRPESSSHRQTDQQTTAQHQLPNDFMAQQQLLQQHQQHEEETPLKEILRKITNIMQEVKPLSRNQNAQKNIGKEVEQQQNEPEEENMPIVDKVLMDLNLLTTHLSEFEKASSSASSTVAQLKPIIEQLQQQQHQTTPAITLQFETRPTACQPSYVVLQEDIKGNEEIPLNKAKGQIPSPPPPPPPSLPIASSSDITALGKEQKQKKHMQQHIKDEQLLATDKKLITVQNQPPAPPPLPVPQPSISQSQSQSQSQGCDAKKHKKMTVSAATPKDDKDKHKNENEYEHGYENVEKQKNKVFDFITQHQQQEQLVEQVIDTLGKLENKSKENLVNTHVQQTPTKAATSASASSGSAPATETTDEQHIKSNLNQQTPSTGHTASASSNDVLVMQNCNVNNVLVNASSKNAAACNQDNDTKSTKGNESQLKLQIKEFADKMADKQFQKYDNQQQQQQQQQLTTRNTNDIVVNSNIVESGQRQPNKHVCQHHDDFTTKVDDKKIKDIIKPQQNQQECHVAAQQKKIVKKKEKEQGVDEADDDSNRSSGSDLSNTYKSSYELPSPYVTVRQISWENVQPKITSPPPPPPPPPPPTPPLPFTETKTTTPIQSHSPSEGKGKEAEPKHDKQTAQAQHNVSAKSPETSQIEPTSLAKTTMLTKTKTVAASGHVEMQSTSATKPRKQTGKQQQHYHQHQHYEQKQQKQHQQQPLKTPHTAEDIRKYPLPLIEPHVPTRATSPFGLNAVEIPNTLKQRSTTPSPSSTRRLTSRSPLRTGHAELMQAIRKYPSSLVEPHLPTRATSPFGLNAVEMKYSKRSKSASPPQHSSNDSPTRKYPAPLVEPHIPTRASSPFGLNAVDMQESLHTTIRATTPLPPPYAVAVDYQIDDDEQHEDKPDSPIRKYPPALIEPHVPTRAASPFGLNPVVVNNEQMQAPSPAPAPARGQQYQRLGYHHYHPQATATKKSSSIASHDDSNRKLTVVYVPQVEGHDIGLLVRATTPIPYHPYNLTNVSEISATNFAEIISAAKTLHDTATTTTCMFSDISGNKNRATNNIVGRDDENNDDCDDGDDEATCDELQRINTIGSNKQGAATTTMQMQQQQRKQHQQKHELFSDALHEVAYCSGQTGCMPIDTIPLPTSVINRSFDNVSPRPYITIEGYKRVAWPPASEERIVREFTPQPQTQYQPVPAYNQQQQQPPSAAKATPAQQQYRAPSYDIYQQPQQQQQQYPPQAQYQSQAPLSQNQYQQPPQAVSPYQQQPPQQQPAWAQQQQPQQQYQQPPWVQQPQPNQQYQQQPQYQSPLNQYNQAPNHHQAQQQHHQQQPQQQQQQQYNNQYVSQSNQQQFNSYSQPQQQQNIVSHDQVDQHNKLAQDQRGVSPGIITLRKEAPITQQPAPVYSSQPAAISFRESSADVDSLGGSNMRGDLKWPPPEYKEAAAKENEERRKLALGPVCRPRKVKRDYTEFFAKNALSHHYPSYKVPPGTQHMTY